MLAQANSAESKKDIKTRQHLMERTFAQATRYGYQRARWRRLWRVQIQEYLTATIQNIKILLQDVKKPANAMQMRVAKKVNEKASRTRLYARIDLSALQWRHIAGYRRTLAKLLLYQPAEVTG